MALHPITSEPVTDLIIHAPDKTYPIYIGAGLYSALGTWLDGLGLRGKRVIVTNPVIAERYGNALAESLGASLVIIPEGESHKNLDTVRSLYDSFAGLALDRNAVILPLGGGVIGDTVGFAAATYLRGISFVQLPTSLLSMVDSSVGGKVGVNLPEGKNLVGAFKQPEMVVIDTAVLASLPDAERRAGIAEVIKHGLLSNRAELLDPANFEQITPEFVAAAVAVKADVVQRDPYEKNVRAHLNLGHTFGQALEAVSGYTWRHGEAVAVGLVAAARLSHAHGLCDAELPVRVEGIVRAAGLPIACPGYDIGALRAAMSQDKKRANNRVRFVLIKEPGSVDVYDNVPENLVMDAWRSVCEVK